MNEAEMEKCDKTVLSNKIQKAKEILYSAGAHFVIDTTNDLPDVVAEINRRMAMGIKP